MTKTTNGKIYDLEDRTLKFSKGIIKLCKELPKNKINDHFTYQAIKSGTSIGANYREANEALTKKDFIHRTNIARKEAKEIIYWLQLIIESNPSWKEGVMPLLNEAVELKKILSKIIENSK